MTYECRIEARPALAILGIRFVMLPPEEMIDPVGVAPCAPAYSTRR
ncbi:MAG: hypothetical protein O2798_08565 [Chloroflexi bacterium]|nr:hypothetical protein [Chloroflexota bacterium]MDA1240876.1 hypothetical protein [Chloroflexota bacterium]